MAIYLKFSQILEPVKIALIDTALQSVVLQMKLKDKLSCKPGCSGCCCRYAQISVAEAVIIYDCLKSSKKWPDVQRRAKEQTSLIKDVEPLSWLKLNIKCSILDPVTNLCLAYKVRPAICSTHFVTSKPEVCDPWSHESSQFLTYDMNNLYFKFKSRLESVIDGFGVFGMYFPIPLALLLAEKISVHSGMDISQVISIIRSEL
jgi:Fe-S-cluster containining protein